MSLKAKGTFQVCNCEEVMTSLPVLDYTGMTPEPLPLPQWNSHTLAALSLSGAP